MRRTVGYIVLSVILVLLQTTLVRYLAIETIVPDLLLIWIVYVALQEGQATATIAGFLIGLSVDLLSGSDGMLGLSALAKTAAGFCAGYFFNENKTQQILGGYQFLLVVGVASSVHNILYFLIFLQGTDLSWWDAILMFGLPATAYTVAAALLPMFVFQQRYHS